MKPEAQCIAIAEACGWTAERWGDKPHEISWITPQQTYGHCPDYLSDLNAMHEAEKVLTDEQDILYFDELALMTCGNTGSFLIHATAAQRAEAFLRTIDKWEDDK